MLVASPLWTARVAPAAAAPNPTSRAAAPAPVRTASRTTAGARRITLRLARLCLSAPSPAATAASKPRVKAARLTEVLTQAAAIPPMTAYERPTAPPAVRAALSDRDRAAPRARLV